MGCLVSQSQGKYRVFAFSFSLKETLALIIVRGQSICGKKSSQIDFFILCIQAKR